jgi:hypothetical protein
MLFERQAGDILTRGSLTWFSPVRAWNAIYERPKWRRARLVRLSKDDDLDGGFMSAPCRMPDLNCLPCGLSDASPTSGNA